MLTTVEKDGLVMYQAFIQHLFPKVTRSIHQFAEEEVILPKGPRKGLHFSIEFMPFTEAIFDAIMDPYWKKIALVGPTQSGKSLLGNNIPMLYSLFEEEEDIIVGIPQMDLATGIWQEKILPVILSTKYKNLIPDKGAGARGGTPTAMKFKNGVWLRFMGAGGGDEQRSSHTAARIIMTEVDKMDDIGESSEEADPVSQIEMRTDSFDDQYKIIMECTVTHEMGRIWQEAMVLGSGGKIYVPCPACDHYQTLTKDGLTYENENVLAAEQSARYRCEECGDLWDDFKRKQALDAPLIVHRDQAIENGEVVGDMPSTRTFGLHWNVLYSPMQSLGKTAAQQWEADHSELKEKKKAMCQSKWALPWSDDENLQELTISGLQRRCMRSAALLKTIPDWMDWLIFVIDVQKDWLYWATYAYRRDMTSQLVEIGVVDVINDRLDKALDEAYGICNEGWRSGTDVHIPRLALVDTGYREDIIVPWLTGRTHWVGIKGIGQYQVNKITGKKSGFRIPGILDVMQQDAGHYLWFIHVDQTKALVHDRLMMEKTSDGDIPAGYFILPEDTPKSFLAHLVAERRVFDEKTGKTKWQKMKRRNDYLDTSSYAAAGAMYLVQHEEQFTQKKTVAQAQVQRRQYQRESKNWFKNRGRMYS